MVALIRTDHYSVNKGKQEGQTAVESRPTVGIQMTKVVAEGR